MISKNDWEKKLSPALRRSDPVKANVYNRVIIEMTGRGNDRIHAIIQAQRGEVIRETRLVPSIIAQIPLSALQELACSDQVKKIWCDSEVKVL